MNARWMRTMLISCLILLMGLQGDAQTPGFFQNYPGGFSRAVYEMRDARLPVPARLIQQVTPQGGDRFEVQSNVQFQGLLEQLEVGLLELVAKLATTLAEEPLAVLLEKVAELEASGDVLLPSGARFSAQGQDRIAGVEVIRGVLTFRNDSDRRLQLALTADPAVPLPPLLILERREDKAFTEDFRLELKEFQREP